MTPQRPPYRAQVPAVARAVQALEQLAGADQPVSLSSLALAATREGTQALRFVPPLAADPVRLPASIWARPTPDSLVEGELQPGVWLLGTTLPGLEPEAGGLLAIAGPASRLRADGAARRALVAAVESVSGGAGLAAGPIGARGLNDFLQQPLVARPAYLSGDG